MPPEAHGYWPRPVSQKIFCQNGAESKTRRGRKPYLEGAAGQVLRSGHYPAISGDDRAHILLAVSHCTGECGERVFNQLPDYRYPEEIVRPASVAATAGTPPGQGAGKAVAEHLERVRPGEPRQALSEAPASCQSP